MARLRSGKRQSNNNDKQAWEVRKLQAEVAALRSPWKTPAVVAALIVAIGSLIGNIGQWRHYNEEYTLAQIKTAQLDLKVSLLQNQAAVLDKAIAAKNRELSAATNVIAETTAVLKDEAAPRDKIRESQSL